ncbi:Aste57867_16983 [Aphanomyces stellatus]|uniref:Aste57867_16983 protein n=1 Tax=Aphanomyces stellatus TaxID=120398 RepID=A0A485L8K7_9STRA|nr:hypothetical protein As57867_016925 [Aphanomyces stellatus]VFT93744.1 Aste57867_16983 [Aphanomyces stellatus]
MRVTDVRDEALRELKRFYNDHDPNHSFVGLNRVIRKQWRVASTTSKGKAQADERENDKEVQKILESNQDKFQRQKNANKVNSVVDLSNQKLKELARTKQNTGIMRGVFVATAVAIPTSFVILPVHLTKVPIENQELQSLVMFMCNKTIDLGKTLAHAVKTNSAYISTGAPKFLYLVDEVEGTPVFPPNNSDQTYPIRITM